MPSVPSQKLVSAAPKISQENKIAALIKNSPIWPPDPAQETQGQISPVGSNSLYVRVATCDTYQKALQRQKALVSVAKTFIQEQRCGGKSVFLCHDWPFKNGCAGR